MTPFEKKQRAAMAAGNIEAENFESGLGVNESALRVALGALRRVFDSAGDGHLSDVLDELVSTAKGWGHPPAVSSAWVLSQLAGMGFRNESCDAYDYMKRCLDAEVDRP